MKSAVVVTGGAGFIGSHVCERLLKNGYEVVCVDNFNDYYNPEIKERNIMGCTGNSNFKLYRADVTDIKVLEGIFSENRVDAVIHAAAQTGVRPSIENPFIYEKVNVLGTLNMLELAKRFAIKKFIFTSSSSVYGITNEACFSEDNPINNPISQYAATKAGAELLCRAYNNLYKIPTVCLRLFTVYGPRGRPDMAPYKFMRLIKEGKEVPMYGDGASKRDFTYISDVVDGIISALERGISFEVINLGNSQPIELNKLISLIEKYVGKKAKIKAMEEQKGDVPITCADISKAKRLLDYNPKVKLEEGIKRMVEWYMAQ